MTALNPPGAPEVQDPPERREDDVELMLCATDGSTQSEKALRVAADLAKLRASKVVVVHVQARHGAAQVPLGLEGYEQLEHVRVTEADILRSVAERIADEGVRLLRKEGVEEVEALVLQGDPAGAVVQEARVRGADAIVMGSRGLGDLQGLLLGSVSHKVAHLAPCTCILVR